MFARYIRDAAMKIICLAMAILAAALSCTAGVWLAVEFLNWIPANPVTVALVQPWLLLVILFQVSIVLFAPRRRENAGASSRA
jgi:ABC-type multidrug transport system fused ATPase/permease subunit